MRPVNEIIVHCTATRPDFMAGHSMASKVQEIRRWHVEGRGWSDIGYHYLIDRDGTIAEGRPITRTGAHVRGHNTGTIGVSLFGGHGSSENDRFEDNFTPAQEAALRNLLHKLQREYGITKVTGHNQYAAKACPGFNVPRWLARKPARNLAQSTTLQAAGVVGTGWVTAVFSFWKDLDTWEKMVALAVLGGVGWIARERIKKWAKGVR